MIHRRVRSNRFAGLYILCLWPWILATVHQSNWTECPALQPLSSPAGHAVFIDLHSAFVLMNKWHLTNASLEHLFDSFKCMVYSSKLTIGMEHAVVHSPGIYLMHHNKQFGGPAKVMNMLATSTSTRSLLYQLGAPLHGAVWHALTLDMQPLWVHASKLCSFLNMRSAVSISCVHGVGHGAFQSTLLRQGKLAMYSANIQLFPYAHKMRVSPTTLMNALDSCEDMPPLRQHGVICAEGVFDVLFMYMDSGGDEFRCASVRRFPHSCYAYMRFAHPHVCTPPDPAACISGFARGAFTVQIQGLFHVSQGQVQGRRNLGTALGRRLVRFCSSLIASWKSIQHESPWLNCIAGCMHDFNWGLSLAYGIGHLVVTHACSVLSNSSSLPGRIRHDAVRVCERVGNASSMPTSRDALLTLPEWF